MRWQAGDITTLPSSRRWTVPKAGCPWWEGPSGTPPTLPTPQPWFWDHRPDPPGLGCPVQSVPYKRLEEVAPLWDGCPWEMARPVLALH